MPSLLPPQRHQLLCLCQALARAVAVLIGIQLGIDSVNPIYYDTIKVCMFFASYMLSANTFPGPLHVPTDDQHIWLLPIILYYFVGSQADNQLYLDPTMRI